MSVLDYIQSFPNYVDKNLCDELVRYYKANAKWETSTFSNSSGILAESSEKVKMDEFWIQHTMKYYAEFQGYFQKAVKEYMRSHPYLAPQRFTPFRLNHYPVGGFMEKHIDNIHHSHGQQFGYPHVTALVLLNDDYQGGEFHLCNDGFIADKQKGTVIVFPSNFMYPHEVKVVSKGDRYSLMTWIM